MKKTLLTLAAAAAVTAFGAVSAEAKVKACFIYVGPIGDFGWSYQHHQGALEAQKELGGEEQVEL
ncbi:MAG: BMP family ABC transporter substrate-binding protein, partial [Hyphomicrobiales bacterium]|nr:BMP family ABC transporter substrate-binding protein [Hyphomicrobiales bacterium]